MESPPQPLFSRISLGTWSLGNDFYAPLSAKEAKDLLALAWELGIRQYDTAVSYGKGLAELYLGQVLGPDRNTQTRISSKILPRSPRLMEKDLTLSLKRLRRDYLDTLYLHWPLPNRDFPAALDCLVRFQERGLVRSLGLSNYSPQDWEKASKSHGITHYQGALNLLYRNMESEFLELKHQRELVFEAYSPLCQGLLAQSRPALATPDPSGHRKSMVLYRPELWSRYLDLRTRLEQLLGQEDLRPLAYGFLLDHPLKPTLVLGASRKAQLRENFQLLKSLGDNLLLLPLLAQAGEISRELTSLLGTFPNIFNHEFKATHSSTKTL